MYVYVRIGLLTPCLWPGPVCRTSVLRRWERYGTDLSSRSPAIPLNKKTTWRIWTMSPDLRNCPFCIGGLWLRILWILKGFNWILFWNLKKGFEWRMIATGKNNKFWKMSQMYRFSSICIQHLQKVLIWPTIFFSSKCSGKKLKAKHYANFVFSDSALFCLMIRFIERKGEAELKFTQTAKLRNELILWTPSI